MTIRVAAVADIHVGPDSEGRLAPHLRSIHEEADVLLLGGDLTQCGTAAEVGVLTGELAAVQVPIIAVLGNHDLHSGEETKIGELLEDAGVCLLEGTTTTVTVDGRRLGVAGTTGFGGGFTGASASDFGEPEMKAFVARTRASAEALEAGLTQLSTDGVDARIALLHYSPVADTLRGERLEIFPFLGSYLLAEAVDRAGADLVLHGHAHGGTEHGLTPGGIRVHNVALPVVRRPYRLFELA